MYMEMAQWLSSIPQTQVKNHMGWHASIIPALLQQNEN